MEAATAPPPTVSMGRWKFAAVVVVTIVMALLACAHVRRVNGPWYWVWPWRAVPWGRAILVGVAALPVMMGVGLFSARRVGVVGAIALIMIGSLAARVASAVVLAERFDLSVVSYRVEHPLITSYYTDALALSGFDG